MKIKRVSIVMLVAVMAISCRYSTKNDVNSMEDPLEGVSDQKKEAMEKASERANPMGEQENTMKQDSIQNDSTGKDGGR